MAGGIVDILIFAILAAVIFFKLFNVLGRRTGHERPPPAPVASPVADNDDQNTVLEFKRQEEEEEPADPLNRGLSQIRRADRSFNPDQFLAGARQAFGMILDAFHKGDLEPVGQFLDRDVRESFRHAIDDRDKKGSRRQIELVAINGCEAIEAGMADHHARITVRFESEQIDVVKDSEDRIIDGDPTRTIEVTDIWTFSRDMTSRDPNWLLVATRRPA